MRTLYRYIGVHVRARVQRQRQRERNFVCQAKLKIFQGSPCCTFHQRGKQQFFGKQQVNSNPFTASLSHSSASGLCRYLSSHLRGLPSPGLAKSTLAPGVYSFSPGFLLLTLPYSIVLLTNTLILNSALDFSAAEF